MVSDQVLKPFDQIWKKVIFPVLEAVQTECDPSFVEQCHLVPASLSTWKNEVYGEYLCLRDQLKNICYGPSNHHGAEELLDGRKIAAVLCSALIRKKCFAFDSAAAQEATNKKIKELVSTSCNDSVQFNLWAVNNIYVNYKLAYYASLQMVFLTLMHDLLSVVKREKRADDPSDAKRLIGMLNERGHLFSYPTPAKGDGFDVNVIIGLARTDISGNELDTFLFAMQLYQIEAHTIDKLQQQISDETA